MRKVVSTIAACLTLAVVAFGLGAATQASSRPRDPQVAWVAADGQIDRSKLPECFVALDRNGNPKKDRAGKVICVPSSEVYPNSASGSVAPKDNSTVKNRTIAEDGSEVIEVEPDIKP